MTRIAARWCLSLTMLSVACVAACSDVGDNTPFVPGSANDAGSGHDASLQDSATSPIATDSAVDATHTDAIDDGSDAAPDRTTPDVGVGSSGSTVSSPSSGSAMGSSGVSASGSSSGVSASGSSGTMAPDAGTSTPDAGVTTAPDATTGATDGGVRDTGTTQLPDTEAPDAGTAVAPDAGALESGSADSGTVPETGALDATIREAGAPDAGRPDVSVPDAAPSPCAQYNNGNGCTPTEQKFVDKSVACYACLVNASCLNDNAFGDITKECEDLTGNAAGGPKVGTPNSALCHATLDCILATRCASADVSTCYCGTLVGSACATASGPADGPCAQVEAEGVSHSVTDPASVVSPLLADVTLPSGKADAIFACANLNMCGPLCSQ